MMPETVLLVKSIPIRKPSHLDLIPSIWMKMKKKCFKSVELASPILKVKKLQGKSEKRSLKKHVD